MRATLDGLGEPDHLGLAYERWAPIDARTGKIPDAQRAPWLKRLSNQPMPAHYPHAYRRWLASFQLDGSIAKIGETASRLLVGHGAATPTEVGITVHPTWGVPMIPGSALKGLLNHYIDAVYGPGPLGVHPLDGRVPPDEVERARYQGVTWEESQILHGPGDVHRRLFGAPRARSDEDVRERSTTSLFQPRDGVDEGLMRETGAIPGSVIFQDALYVPPERGGGTPFAEDVITVHQKAYYNERGKTPPNDYDDPNPISFLTVRPGTQFLLALSGPRDWTDFAMRHLCDALTEWGVGAKTTAGYGLFKQEWKTVLDGRAPASSLVTEIEQWFSSDKIKASVQGDKLTLFRQEWLPRFQGASADDRERATKLLRKNINARKRQPELEALLAELEKA